MPALAAILTLEGCFFVGYAVLELFHLDSGRVAMGATTSVFFAGWGLALIWCARALRRHQSWARGPVVMTQVVHLMVAWGFRGGSTTWVAVVGVALSLAVLALLLNPRSIRELAR